MKGESDGWLIGMSEDSRTGRVGLVARHRSDPRGLDSIRVDWHEHGDAREIAARIRDLANTMEREAVGASTAALAADVNNVMAAVAAKVRPTAEVLAECRALIDALQRYVAPKWSAGE